MRNELEQYRGNGLIIPGRPENGNGHLIVRPDQYQAQVVEAMNRYVEANPHWEYRDHYMKAMKAASEFIPRMFNGVIVPGRNEMPFPVVGFDNLRNYLCLASYHLVPNKHGLNYEITFNTQSFREVDTPGGKKKEWAYGGDWGFYETELHELTHCWQQTVVTHEKPDHNKTFRDKMMEFGIPTADNGSHLELAKEGSPFDILMKEWMVARPDLKDMPQGADLSWLIWWFEQMFGKEKRKGKSTLILYECPDCGDKIRWGKAKEEAEISCVKCSRKKGISTEGLVLFERQD
jgi:DNA-directed RNA polymerase subunit RPC12/RpoP